MIQPTCQEGALRQHSSGWIEVKCSSRTPTPSCSQALSLRVSLHIVLGIGESGGTICLGTRLDSYAGSILRLREMDKNISECSGLLGTCALPRIGSMITKSRHLLAIRSGRTPVSNVASECKVSSQGPPTPFSLPNHVPRPA
jgi:hypothetical protein